MTDLAVIDVETTGLNPYGYDRVIELAALVINPDGEVLRELVTLVNPERDVGPTRIHGLSARDVVAAPRFDEIAAQLLEVLHGCVALAGHNVQFDLAFLAAEFHRLGHSFPEGPMLCTMQLAGGGSLRAVCSDYGVAFDGAAHTALHDARATAHLLALLLKDAPRLTSEISSASPIAWPSFPRTQVTLQTRDDSRMRQAEPPTYLQALMAQVQPDLPPDDVEPAVLAYTGLLDRILEDRHIGEEEGLALIDLAARWGMPGHQIQTLHRDYLLGLCSAAMVDGIVTDGERQDLKQVASLLGLASLILDEMLAMAAQERIQDRRAQSADAGALGGEGFAGKRVCFTGDCQCLLKGAVITRQMAEDLAAGQGLIVVEAVTKKLDLLVVADPLTQSGKAKKARRYGIRILHELVFWRSLGLEVA